MTLKLSTDQKAAYDAITTWYKQKKPVLTLGGYAGTGKTTLISVFKKNLSTQKGKKDKPPVAFVSYTGKAARVLKDSLTNLKALNTSDYVGTIHSLIYSPVLNSAKEIVGWERKEKIDAELIIVDEASMVDQNIWNDLKSYGVPILAVGDHGQLPPINGDFNLMDNPDIKLTQIHRQARDNPIIKVASHIRETGKVPDDIEDDRFKKIDRRSDDAQLQISELLENFGLETMILCGYNHTRIRLNQHIRTINELVRPMPEVGDRVICLRNNHEKEIYNGMTGIIKHLEEDDKDWYYAEIEMNGLKRPYKGLISSQQFGNSSPGLNYTKDRALTLKGDLFDFGYAVTVHKAQGSQAKEVILFAERFSKMDDEMWKRWLYTGVTRATERLVVVA